MLQLTQLEDRFCPADLNLVVDNLTDVIDEAMSLRRAITVANSDVAADAVYIRFDEMLEGTIKLESPLPLVSRAHTYIKGPGASVIDVVRQNGSGHYRIFGIAGSHCEISGLGVRNGSLDQGIGGGIAVLADDATISQCTISGNYSAGGGGGVGIYSAGYATISDCVILGNSSAGPGGGVFVGASSDFANTVVDGNKSATEGGGIAVIQGSSADADVFIRASQISNNTSEGKGGGLFLTRGDGATDGVWEFVRVESTAVHSNISLSGSGGAVYNDVRAEFSDCSFASNSGAADGYAIHDNACRWDRDSVFTQLVSCTVSGNQYSAQPEGPAPENVAAVLTRKGEGNGRLKIWDTVVSVSVGHGVRGWVRSSGGNWIDNSITESVGWAMNDSVT